MRDFQSFRDFFKQATGNTPFPYQQRLAEQDVDLLDVPTGLGKTAAAVLGWLWRRRYANPQTRKCTPRRLVYCLPMRVLVEQTTRSAQRWIEKLRLEDVGVHQLMGGELDDSWQRYPERDAILVGTQDMLLSRALNRGFAMSRFMWPMAFGLLHSDAMWVFDEVQLMGSGLATTAQLDAFRKRLGTTLPSKSLWMSATLQADWLETVDFREPTSLRRLTLQPADRDIEAVHLREHAPKLKRAPGPTYSKKELKPYVQQLKERVIRDHVAETLTLVIVNTVERACMLYEQLTKAKSLDAELVLLHSRFRPEDRRQQVSRLAIDLPAAGRIVVSTQVVEAGVDISARLLVTELAPWASLVQRLGRCNRRGEHSQADVVICDIDSDDEKASLPYRQDEVALCREHLALHEDLAPAALKPLDLPFEHGLVLRHRDLLELFDTTADLSGSDIDISPYVRETDDHDVHVFWRALSEGNPDAGEALPSREELCPVPIGDMRAWAKKKDGWSWDIAGETWMRLRDVVLRPGMTVMLRAESGGYLADRGWWSASKQAVSPLGVAEPPEAFGGDPMSVRAEATIADHTERVVQQMAAILDPLALPEDLDRALREAARLHDVGKAHPVFQKTMYGGQTPPEGGGLLAKSKHAGVRHERKGFRHELASGLALLANGYDDFIVFLVAGHHGRVRLAIRSRPDETLPESENGVDHARRVALGIWDKEKLPAVDAGGGTVLAETELDLSVMELGRGPLGPSWLERMLSLRDDLDVGPFRMGFAEALLRAADHRGSEVLP
jgi:CRISPR-associated endonuclease/helicase Cas3